MPGTRSKRFNSRIIAKVAAPTAKAYQLVLPSITACASSHSSCNGPRPSIGMANILGNWLTSTVNAMPFM
ncbi:hypothetical protein D3C72_711500 [compost metagenome]